MSLAVEVFASEPVTRYRRGPTTRDSHGNQRGGAWQPDDLPGCSVVPGTATENTTEGFAQLDSTATLYGPDGLDLTSADEVGWRGARWAVNGVPQVWAAALTSGIGTVVVALQRREG